MLLLFAISLILGGVIASASFIIRNKPDARKMIAKLIPFQGWIGIFLAIIGVIGIFKVLLAADRMRIVWLITPLLCLALGFLLAYQLIQQMLLKRSAAASAQGERVLNWLTTWQTPLGLTGIVVGLWALLNYLGI